MSATCKRCLVLPTCLLLLCSHMAPQMSAGLLSCSPFDSPTDRLITVYPTSLAPSWLRLVLPHLNIWGAGRKYLVHSNPLSGRRFYYLCWFSAIPAWPFCYIGHLRINLWEEVSTLCVVAQFHVVSCLATTKTFRVTSFLAMSCTTGLETKRARAQAADEGCGWPCICFTLTTKTREPDLDLAAGVNRMCCWCSSATNHEMDIHFRPLTEP